MEKNIQWDEYRFNSFGIFHNFLQECQDYRLSFVARTGTESSFIVFVEKKTDTLYIGIWGKHKVKNEI